MSATEPGIETTHSAVYILFSSDVSCGRLGLRSFGLRSHSLRRPPAMF